MVRTTPSRCREGSHGQLGVRYMLPDDIAVAGKRDGTIQPVGLARQRLQMVFSIGHGLRLVEDLATERHGLIRADDERSRKAIAHLFRLRLGQDQSHGIGAGAVLLQRRLYGALVDISGDGLKMKSRIFHQHPTKRA